MGVGPRSHLAANAAAGLVSSPSTGRLAEGGQHAAILGNYLASMTRLVGARAGLVCYFGEEGEGGQLVAATGLPMQLSLSESVCQVPCASCAASSSSALRPRATSAQAAKWLVGEDQAVCLARDKLMPASKATLLLPLRSQGRLLGCCQLFFDSEQQPQAELLTMLGAASELIGLSLLQSEQSRELLCATVLDERRLMAAELHDTIAQNLVYMNMRLPLLRDALASSDQSGAERYLDDLRRSLQSSQGDLRELLTQYRTAMDPRGLPHALGELADDFRQRCNTRLDLQCEPGAAQLPADQALQIFHIVQEGLSNVIRHAGARQAWLKLAQADDCLELTLADDGQGLAGVSTLPSAGHFGLRIMHERAERLGATLQISPREGGGTMLRLLQPLGLGLRKTTQHRSAD